jgi:hypothetical protein
MAKRRNRRSSWGSEEGSEKRTDVGSVLSRSGQEGSSVLIQREMELVRSVSEYNAISASSLHVQRSWRMAEWATLESTTGFKKEIRWSDSPQGALGTESRVA